MNMEELVEELERSQLTGEHLWRLNEAVFNVEEDALMPLSRRIFQLALRVRKDYQAGRFYKADRGEYLALLGTLQNQRCLTGRQGATLRAALAEALGAEAQEAPKAGNSEAKRRLQEQSKALAAQLAELKRLKGAVETFLTWQGPEPKAAAKAKAKEMAKKEKGKEKEPEASQPKAVKAPKPNEVPGYQVRTDMGWSRYDDGAQKALGEAAQKGRHECEIFAQGQYYKVDLKRMVQINPSTGNERQIRLSGKEMPVPEMPKLNMKRLLLELKQLETAIAQKEAPEILSCKPVEDNLMEWELEMTFPPESVLQQSLENLAASMFDSSLNRLTLCLRFPVEFPMSPPEVWLRRPRMQHRAGTGPVTFGGRVCNILLASAGWQPATSILTVLKEVQKSLVESEMEANTMVHIKKDYPKASIQLERLNTELFHTVNGFCKDGMTAISPQEAAAFLGDLSRLEATDKIGLPFSYANAIYQRAELGAELTLPMVFEVKTLLGRKTHCAIFEFVDGLPDMHVLLPKWVMDDLAIDEHEPVRVRGVELQLVTAVRVQPHSVGFYHAVRDSKREVKELLTESLGRFSTLTEDTAVPIEVDGQWFQVQVIAVEPAGAVRIIDMDVEHHFEFKVEFEPAPDLEDEAATKEYQDRVLGSIKLRRERSAASRQELQERRQQARLARYEQLLQRARLRAEEPSQEATGEVETALRMPDGSQVKGRFPENVPVAHLVVLALESDWAKKALPWGIYLRMAFPKKVLKEEDPITRDLHRSALSVQEEQAPDKDEELFKVLRSQAASPSRRRVPSDAVPEVLAPPPVPERDEATLLARTQRAFEMQRFLRAGLSLEEAEAKYEAGEILPPDSPMRRPSAKPAKPQLRRSLSEEEERETRIQAVISFTGVERAAAEKALEENNWITDSAVNSVLDSLVGE